MRILLIKPRWFGKGVRRQVRYATHVRFPALGLGIIAALSKGHQVTIADEDWDRLPLEKPFDLVGITVTTFASERAFQLADLFRARGVPVVMGGVHASMAPDECLEHANAVVIGEAEYIWGRVLHDAERSVLSGKYQADRLVDLDEVPGPRRDLMNELPWFTVVETSRGCPNKCKYCYLPSVPWHQPRKRSIESVAKEVAGLKQSAFMFVDENLFSDAEHAKALFRRIAKHRKIWLAQAPTNIWNDLDLLDAMREGGCFDVQIGFQSFNRKVLQDAAVFQNRVEEYAAFVRRLHERRIVVSGFFLFGFDSDTKEVFPQTVEAIRSIGLDDATLFVVTPFPGTPFHAELAAAKRLLPDRPRTDYGWSRAVFQPKNMTPDELEHGVRDSYRALYPHFRARLKHVLWSQAARLACNPRFALALIRGNIEHPGL